MFSIICRNPNRRKFPSYRLFSLFLATFTIAILLIPARASAGGNLNFAAVNTAKLSIRKSASTRARVVVTLTQGEVVQITAVKGEWNQIMTSGGKSGWCQARYLTKASDSAAFKPAANALLDWPSEYINVTQTVTYQRCMQDMKEIAAAYPDLARIETIGDSVMGNPINAIVLGKPGAGARILVQASMHAREMISSLVALRQAECILKAATMGATYQGVKVSALLGSVEIWVVPMTNPDGARLVYEGLAAVPPSMPALAASLKKMNKNSKSFYHWKANANGVDLNRNFDANWKTDPKYKKPGMQNYAGPSPFSEPETVALRDLTAAKDFAMTLSYHSSGKLIYWNDPNGGPNDLNQYIAKEVKSHTGYRILAPAAQAPSGGYRDWYVKQYKRPGLTIELGSGYCPLPMSSFASIWSGNRFVLLDMVWIVAPKSLSNYAN